MIDNGLRGLCCNSPLFGRYVQQLCCNLVWAARCNRPLFERYVQLSICLVGSFAEGFYLKPINKLKILWKTY